MIAGLVLFDGQRALLQIVCDSRVQGGGGGGVAPVEARGHVGHAGAREGRAGHPGGVPRHGQPEADDDAEGMSHT